MCIRDSLWGDSPRSATEFRDGYIDLSLSDARENQLDKIDRYPIDPLDVPVSGDHVIFRRTYQKLAYNEATYDSGDLGMVDTFMFNHANDGDATGLIVQFATTSPHTEIQELATTHGRPGRVIHIFEDTTGVSFDGQYPRTRLDGAWHGEIQYNSATLDSHTMQIRFLAGTVVSDQALTVGKNHYVAFESPMHGNGPGHHWRGNG